jgi:hypothetical protein
VVFQNVPERDVNYLLSKSAIVLLEQACRKQVACFRVDVAASAVAPLSPTEKMRSPAARPMPLFVGNILCHSRLHNWGITGGIALGKVPAVHLGSGTSAPEGAGFQSPSGPSAFQRELDRARRHLAKLEAEDQLRRQQPVFQEDDASFDESPTFVRVCNLLIWAIVLLPVALAVIALARRVAG